APETEETSEEGPQRRGTAVRFFLLPLLVVATAVGLFWIFSRMTFDRRSPADYLEEVRGGTANRRWQAAFELSRTLPNLDPPERAALTAETLRVFKSLSPTRSEDVPVRRYLVLVLGRLGDREAVQALLSAAKEPDADTRLYAVWALGKLGDPRALATVSEASLSEDPGMRKIAAYVLGQLGDRAAAPRLQVLLEDPVADVRWNSAIALASLSDRSGLHVLRSMIDRSALARQAQLSAEQSETAMVGALKALALLRDEESLPMLERVAREDPDLRVREAARQAVEATRPLRPESPAKSSANLERCDRVLVV
ncbi:MAG TPA: HEAT repeat domain-containing protein, partial [Thermoanaerobaculia bacterium]|nr:HEAT repeat domain-containing protein [Thermoanaerobaculia bacterium]